MGSGNKQVIGYRYYLGLHMGICHGPVDEFQSLLCGDRAAWEGSVTASSSVQVHAGELFGGEKKEGGVDGQLDIAMGEPSQGQNSYLASKIAANVPAFRGILSLIWRGGYVSAMTPYIKAWAPRVKRIKAGWTTALWDGSHAEIAGDMNPAHILYQCITDSNWGMGYGTSFVDSTSFLAASSQLFAEGFGLSMIWNQQESIENFMKLVLDHCGGILYVRPDTGTFALKLIRADYDRASLAQYDASNVIAVEGFQRQAWGETTNEITVTYIDRATAKKASITVQDLANIATQGQVVAQTKPYPGIPNAGLANRVAMRDLMAASTPVSRATLKVNRKAWNLMPGAVFRLTWPAYDVDDVVYRVTSINKGTLSDGTISVEIVEDIFSMPSNTYIGDQPPGWVDPISDPVPITYRRLVEATFWDITRTKSVADMAYLDPLAGWVVTMGSKPTPDAYSYQVWSTHGASSFAETGQGYFTPTATIVGALSKTSADVTVPYANDLNVDLVTAGSYAIIDDEYVVVKSLDTGTKTLVLTRGILDTVPADHADGVRIWFADDYKGLDETEYVSGETVGVKMLPRTGLGVLDISAATQDNLDLQQRAARPYPPGKVRVDGMENPTALTGTAFVLTWAHRDRTTQTAYFVDQASGSIGPEAGVTYTVQIYNAASGGSMIRQYTGITGDSQYYPYIQGTIDNGGTPLTSVRVELIAVRGGLSSWQRWVIAATWTPGP